MRERPAGCLKSFWEWEAVGNRFPFLKCQHPACQQCSTSVNTCYFPSTGTDPTRPWYSDGESPTIFLNWALK